MVLLANLAPGRYDVVESNGAPKITIPDSSNSLSHPKKVSILRDIPILFILSYPFYTFQHIFHISGQCKRPDMKGYIIIFCL